ARQANFGHSPPGARPRRPGRAPTLLRPGRAQAAAACARRQMPPTILRPCEGRVRCAGSHEVTDSRSPAGRRLLMVMGTMLLTVPLTAGEDPLLTASRDIAADFGDRLRAALQAAMVEAGPAGAVDICKEVAPGIASELSRTTGAQVGRTSLRVRNPRNL